MKDDFHVFSIFRRCCVMTGSEMFVSGHIWVPRFADLIKLKGSPCNKKSHIDSQEAIQFIELILLCHVVKYATAANL